MNITILTITITLLLIYILPVLVFKNKLKSIFNPININAIIHIGTTIPYMILVAIDENNISTYVLNHISFDSVERSILRYFIVQSIGYISIVLGILLSSKFIISKNTRINFHMGLSETNKSYIKGYIFLMLIGLCGYIYLINSIGGINYLLSNIHMRTSILSGKSYILNIIDLMFISVYFLIYSCKFKDSKLKRLFIIFNIGIVFAMMSVFGGRKDPLYFLLTSAIVWNFSVNRIKIINYKVLILIIPLSIYFICVPLFRTPGKFEYYKDNPDVLVENIIESSNNIVKQTSYVDHYLLIINYFKDNLPWMGVTYLDLLKAPIPSTIIDNKPPVDDGVYVRTIAEGIDVKPNTPFKELYQSSWPPETLGIAYMNYKIIGVIIFMIILGFIYGKVYLYMKQSNYNLFYIYLYSVIITGFHLSNLRIVQTGMDILTAVIIFSLILGIRITRKTKRGIFYAK